MGNISAQGDNLSVINVNDGARITGDDVGIALNGNAVVNVSGGTVTGVSATGTGIEVDAVAYTGYPELVLYRFSTVDADGAETVVQDWSESPHLSLPLEGHGTVTIKVDTTIANISYTKDDRSYQHTVRY